MDMLLDATVDLNNVEHINSVTEQNTSVACSTSYVRSYR
jgi:hypothetical protein